MYIIPLMENVLYIYSNQDIFLFYLGSYYIWIFHVYLPYKYAYINIHFIFCHLQLLFQLFYHQNNFYFFGNLFFCNVCVGTYLLKLKFNFKLKNNKTMLIQPHVGTSISTWCNSFFFSSKFLFIHKSRTQSVVCVHICIIIRQKIYTPFICSYTNYNGSTLMLTTKTCIKKWISYKL